jgi:TonB family protein
MRTVTRHSLSVVTLITLGLIPVVSSGQVQKDEWAGGWPEYLARKAAIQEAMPIYPEEALRRGVSGRVEVKITIGEEGEVLGIKVRPRTDPQLKEALANAVSRWKFKPRDDQDRVGRPILTRLSFNFVLAEGRVELFKSGPTSPDTHHLGYHSFAKDRREWIEWEELPLIEAP